MLRIGSYERAEAFLKTTGGESMLLPGNSTRLIAIESPVADVAGPAYAVAYRTSLVLIFLADGSTIFYGGPWGSETAAYRMDSYGPEDVHVRRIGERRNAVIELVVQFEDGSEDVHELLGFAARVHKDGKVDQMPGNQFEHQG